MFESQGESTFQTVSPGGFEFGVQGWVWGAPVPKSITFYLDNTASVCDQYGRYIRRSLLPDGSSVKFADCPPEANRENKVYLRPQFATHQEVLDALKREGINWLAYEVRWRGARGPASKGGMTLEQATKEQARLLKDQSVQQVTVGWEIQRAGWPQLDYDDLKKLPDVPPTPMSDLQKIQDPDLRRAAMKLRRETDAERAEEIRGELEDVE